MKLHTWISLLCISSILFIQSSLGLAESKGLKELISMEQDVESTYQGLVGAHLSTEGFYENVIYPVNRGGKAALNLDYLREWERGNSLFHQKRYEEIKQKQIYFMEKTHAAIHALVASKLNSDTPSELESKVLKNLETLDSEFNKWSLAKNFVGEGFEAVQQRDRMYPIYDYFVTTRELLKDLGEGPGRLEDGWRLPKWKRVKGGTGAALSACYLGTQILTRELLSRVNRINPLSYCLPESVVSGFNRTVCYNSTPFTSGWGLPSLLGNVADFKGYDVQVEGRENLEDIPLQASADRKVVNLFLPPHRSEVGDALLLGKLGLPHFLMFSNPSAYAPHPWVGNVLASLPEFISVGKWKGYPPLTPAEKLFKSLEEKRSPNVINFPQGFVSRMGEILPMHHQFEEKLIRPLIQKGYEVNVVPMTFEVDSGHLSRSGGSDDLKIRAKFHPPLRHSTVKALVELEDSSLNRVFNHFMSTFWFEKIQTHKELSVEELLRRTRKNLSPKVKLSLCPGSLLDAL